MVGDEEHDEFCAWHRLVIIIIQRDRFSRRGALLFCQPKERGNVGITRKNPRRGKNTRRNIWGSFVARCRNYPSPFSPFSLLITLFVLAGFDHFGWRLVSLFNEFFVFSPLSLFFIFNTLVINVRAFQKS